MSMVGSNINALKAPPSAASTPLNLIGRRLFEEAGCWPAYSRLKSWAYDGLYPTVRVGSKSAIAESDWPEAKRKILLLNSAT
jgi:hypothetical protein